MKYIIKKKNNIYKAIRGLDQTHSKKRRQTLPNQAKQNQIEEVDTYYEKKSNLIITGKISYHLKSNLFLTLSEVSLLAQWFFFFTEYMRNFEFSFCTYLYTLSPSPSQKSNNEIIRTKCLTKRKRVTLKPNIS